MKKSSLLFCVVAILAFVTAPNAQTPLESVSNPETQQQKDKRMLLSAAQFLEEKPFDEKAKAIRGWAVGYVIQTDQVNVVVCGGPVMQSLLDKKNKNGTELIGQYTIGMAAFKLQYTDKKNDENAAQLAGVESALKTYRMMIKEKPKTSLPGMDDLVAKSDKGELKALIDAADCGKKSK